jgi:predicted NBD/HSP70 family sugar kinase
MRLIDVPHNKPNAARRVSEMIDPSAAEKTTPDGTRQRNLARVLRLVHLDGPLPRAALTETTGLNRSTIGDLVGELVRLDLAEERAPDPSRRVGRPSPVVSAASNVVAIAVNPEVDAVTLAAVGLDRTISLRARAEVNHLTTPEDATGIIAAQVDAWRRGDLAHRRIVAIGLAVPGLVRASDGLVRNAPHLRWSDAPVGDLVTEATGIATSVGNDATLGAIAEHLFGAARGVDDVVYLNGGASGIGGGLIIGGVPVPGAGGYAGEFGQNRPGIASASDRRAADGVLEDEVSRSRLLAAAELMTADEPTLAAALRAPRSVTVAEELARQRRILATALANAVNVLNPSVVVLGGFLAILAEYDLDGLREAVAAQAMPASMEGLSIRTAVLAEDRLLIGAAELAFADLLRDPAAFAP